MAKYSIDETTLVDIADAIRDKTGNTNSIQVANMATEIAGITTGSSGGASVETCTATIVSDGVGSAFTNNMFYTSFNPNLSRLMSSAGLYVKNSSVPIAMVVKGSAIYFDAANIMSINGEGIEVHMLSTSKGYCAIGINSDAPDEITITLSSNN